MANPITWRNVVGPSLADAARPLDAATRTLNGAFDQLQSVLKEREAIDAGNVLVQQENQKNAFLDMLQRATSPEQLSALQQSQEFQAAQAALSPAARAATRGAVEQRLATTRDLVTKGQTYDINQRDFKEQPEVAAINALIEAGKFDEARARLDAVQLRDETPLEQALRLRQRGKVKEGYEDNAEKRSQASHEDGLKTSAANRALTGIRIQDARLGLTERQRQLSESDAVRKASVIFSEVLGNHLQASREYERAGVPVAQRPTDTFAFQQAYDRAISSGLPAEAVLKAMASARGQFDSGNITSPVGADARALEVAKAKAAEERKYFEENSPAARGSTDPLRTTGDVAQFIATTVKDPDEQKALNAALVKVSNEGIRVKGKEIRNIPMDILKAAVIGSQDTRMWGTRWARDSNRGASFEEALKALLQNDSLLNEIEARGAMDVRRFQEVMRDAAQRK